MTDPDRPAKALFIADNMRAITWVLISVLGASLMTFAVRIAAVELHPVMIVLIRASVIGVVLIAMMVGQKRKVRITRPYLHLIRGAAIGFSTMLGFYAITKLNLVTATVIFFMAPIWATVFGMVLHGERAGPRRLAAIATGFVGVLVVLRPGAEVFDPAMLYALASSLLFGLALPLSREVAEADGTFTAYLSSVVVTVLVALPVAIPVWHVPGAALIWGAMFGVIIFSALRGVADLIAYRLGEAAVLAPFNYLRLVLIGLGAYVFFAETPDVFALVGAAIIISAALYIAHRERQIARRGQ